MSRRCQRGAHHRGHGPLAVRAGDVDDGVRALGTTKGFGQAADRLEAQLHAEQLEAVEPLAIGHEPGV